MHETEATLVSEWPILSAYRLSGAHELLGKSSQ